MTARHFIPFLVPIVLAPQLFGGDPGLVDAKAVIVAPAEKKALLTFGVGHLQANADEIVYGGPGPGDGRLSELNWDTLHAVTLQLGFTRNLFPRVELFANGVYGFEANSGMVDYDWLGIDDNWTDRSQHPDTELEHYFQGDIGISYLALDQPTFRLFVRGGFRYTDIAWAAYGGSFIYSTLPPLTFRDDRGDFPDGELGIAYRQQFPGIFLGPQFAWDLGRVTVRGGGLAGMTISAADRDRHWSAQSIFVEKFDPQVFVGGNVGVDYAWTKTLLMFLEGVYDKYPLMKGTTEFTDLAAGTTDFRGGAAAGASLETWQIRGGFKVAF